MKIVTTENQTIFDILIQYYGSIEPLFDFMEDNNIVSVNENVNAGTTFIIDENLVVDNSVVDYLVSKKTSVATSDGSVNGDFSLDFNNDF